MVARQRGLAAAMAVHLAATSATSAETPRGAGRAALMRAEPVAAAAGSLSQGEGAPPKGVSAANVPSAVLNAVSLAKFFQDLKSNQCADCLHGAGVTAHAFKAQVLANGYTTDFLDAKCAVRCRETVGAVDSDFAHVQWDLKGRSGKGKCITCLHSRGFTARDLQVMRLFGQPRRHSLWILKGACGAECKSLYQRIEMVLKRVWRRLRRMDKKNKRKRR
mmetsp:Transcript_3454/g.7184  ORF Transcript_3454/g.7184 Transcript_3454/m.7184 type:complete len:219 (-) Transcript_3454:63-719(-)